MILTIRNKVNGKYVKQPDPNVEIHSWVVEYALEPIAPDRAVVIYEQLKKRRRDLLGPRSPSGFDNGFMNRLHTLSRKGRHFRQTENFNSRDKPIHVYGRSDPLKWDDVLFRGWDPLKSLSPIEQEAF